EKQGQIKLDSRRDYAIHHILIDRVFLWIRGREKFGIAVTERGTTFLERKFLCRQYGKLLQTLRGALSFGIEKFQAFNFIIKQVNPNRCFLSRCVDIHDTAAYREFTWIIDGIDQMITGLNQLFLLLFQIKFLTDMNIEMLTQNP